MDRSLVAASILLSLLCLAAEPTTAPVEKVRNDKVLVRQFTLAPGQTQPWTSATASVAVWLDDGTIEQNGSVKSVKRGDNQFVPSPPRTIVPSITNTGSAPLRLVRLAFLTDG